LLKTYVELNNPVILFKCDQKYIYERLFLYMGEEDEERRRQQAEKKRKQDPVKEDFLNLMRQTEPFFPADFKILEEKEKAKLELEKKIFSREIIEYADTLTTWLCDLINSLHKSLDFELIEIRSEGVCIRYCPLDHVNIFGTLPSDLQTFDKSLADIMTVLDASIKCKSRFDRDVREMKNLVSVHVAKWAGIGSVRYIPDDLVDKVEQLREYQLEKIRHGEAKKKLAEEKEREKKVATTESNSSTVASEFLPKPTESPALEPNSPSEPTTTTTSETKEEEAAALSSTETTKSSKSPLNQEEKKEEGEIESSVFVEDAQFEKFIKEIDELNEKLVKKLQAQDGAFSLGQASDGMNAVKFGMVNELDVVKNLAGEVQEVGKELEEASKVSSFASFNFFLYKLIELYGFFDFSSLSKL
jgi:hypothetical protein